MSTRSLHVDTVTHCAAAPTINYCLPWLGPQTCVITCYYTLCMSVVKPASPRPNITARSQWAYSRFRCTTVVKYVEYQTSDDLAKPEVMRYTRNGQWLYRRKIEDDPVTNELRLPISSFLHCSN